MESEQSSEEDRNQVTAECLNLGSEGNISPTAVEGLSLIDEDSSSRVVVEDPNPAQPEDTNPAPGKGPGSWLKTKFPMKNRSRTPDED